MYLFAASLLGIKDLLPAYLGTNLTNQDLITGVSFACGGTGFDLLTAQVAVNKKMNYCSVNIPFIFSYTNN